MSLYEDIFSYHNLYQAHKKAMKGKKWKEEVMLFELNKVEELRKLYESLQKKTYTTSSYKTFKIYEPKERRVDATSYRDRVVQNCFVDNYLNPLLEKRLIYDNAACRIGKGTDFARKRLRKFLYETNRKEDDWYVLRFDIHHYFESIDHSILKKKMERIVNDKEILSFTSMIIDSFHIEDGKGLPLGNRTSQLFALYYLDTFDRIIKERYSIKYYTRYMDDGVIILNDREKLKKLLLDLEKELDSIYLSFNSKKTFIYPLRNGIPYLGFVYRLGQNNKIISRMERKKKKRLIRYLKRYSHTYESLLSYSSYLKKRGNENKLVLNIKEMVKERK